jgi:hypothetical protein
VTLAVRKLSQDPHEPFHCVHLSQIRRRAARAIPVRKNEGIRRIRPPFGSRAKPAIAGGGVQLASGRYRIVDLRRGSEPEQPPPTHRSSNMNGIMTPGFRNDADREALRVPLKSTGSSPEHLRNSSLPANAMVADVAGQRRRTVRRVVHPCAEPGYNQRVISIDMGDHGARSA